MPLTSSSTLSEIEAAYIDNSDWRDGDGDITKARAFAQACRVLLLKYNTSVSGGGASFSRDLGNLRAQLDEAVEWLGANDTDTSGGGVSVFDTRDARL